METSDGKVLASYLGIYSSNHSALQVVWSNKEVEGEPGLGRERDGSETGR
jgi:hypothetical protein